VELTGIPRIIHQSWKTTTIPVEYAPYVDTWKKLHQGWEYRLWTDDHNLQLVTDHYNWLLPVYKSYPLAIQRADMARLLYLHRFGGVYADMDFECLRPFDDFTTQTHIVMGREKGGLGWFRRGQDYISNALLASPPGHPFWERVIEQMVQKTRKKRFYEPRVAYVLGTTGPEILDEVVQTYGEGDLKVYPDECFFPASCLEKNAARRRSLALASNSHGVHHSANTWFTMPMHALVWAGHLARRPFLR